VREWGRRGGRASLAGCVFGVGVIAAPFLALLYGIEVGLGVMAVALATVAGFGMQAAQHAPADLRGRLLLAVALNGVLAVVCLVVLLVRL
jgi:hypothetical protein